MAWSNPIQDVQFHATTSGTTLTFVPSAPIEVGTLLVLHMTTNTAFTVSSTADNATGVGVANNYIPLATNTAPAIPNGKTIYCLVTRRILTTHTVTITIGAAATVRTGRMITVTGAGPPSVLDPLSPTQAASGASPMSVGPTAAPKQSGEFAVLFTVWNNTALGLSGVANSGAGWTLGATDTGNGTATPYEVNYSYRKDASAALTDAHTFTAWSNIGGEIVSFKLPTEISDSYNSGIPEVVFS